MAEQILIIDEDLEHAHSLKTYLERIQFNVTVASDSKDGLRCLNLSPWDIILANPLVDEAVARNLDTFREGSPLTQLIIFGSAAQIDSAMDRYGTAAIHYLEIPINSKSLELALKQARKAAYQIRKINRYTERLADLHNAQNLFNQLFDEVPCYISVQDKNLRITATNKRFKQHFGNTIGGRCYEIYKHRTAPCEKCPVIQTFEDGKVHSTEEVVSSKSGKQYNVLTHTAPLRDETGEITQVMEMATNITQIRQLQDHLTSLGLMLGSMSHGVKGMLTALDGGIYQLETGLKQKDEQRIDKAFGQVKLMTDKIRKMVLEILYYAKSRELQYTTMDVTELVNNITRNIIPLAHKNNIVFDMQMTDSPGKIEIDPSWMEAALINFLENAVDACACDREKQSHTVTFHIHAEDRKTVSFTIEDNGIGMDKETCDKMFTLFFTSKGSQGTGLGLFIANRVIHQHGGSVKVTSEQKQGTTFHIRLPRTRPGILNNNGFPVISS